MMTESLQTVAVAPPPALPDAAVTQNPALPLKAAWSEREIVVAGLLLAVTTAYLLPLTQVLYRIGDDGSVIYGAQRVSEGAIPGRDFVEVMGPAAFCYLGLFFKVFGAAWQVTRLQLLLTGVASIAALYVIARSVLSESAAAFCWLFLLTLGMPVMPTDSHHWDSNLFAILALWSYLRLEKTLHYKWAAGAGLLAGITSCFMPAKGLYLLAAFIMSATLGRSRSKWQLVAFMLTGYAFVGIAIIGTFWQAGALKDLVYANVTFPLSSYGRINAVPYAQFLASVACMPAFQVFSATWALPGFICAGLSLIPFLIIAVLPLLSAGAMTMWMVKIEKRIRWSPLVAIFLAGLALWVSEMHRRDAFHLLFGSPFLLIALFGSAPPIMPAWLRKASSLAIIAGLAVFATLNFMTNTRGIRRVETRRGSIASAADDDALRFLCTSVKPREYVFIYPYQPMYYYLADVRNPTRYSILLYGYNTPAQFSEVIQDLESKRVPWVLWDTVAYGDNMRFSFPAYRHPSADKLLLEQYFQRRYESIGLKSGFRILRRREIRLIASPSAIGNRVAIQAR